MQGLAGPGSRAGTIRLYLIMVFRREWGGPLLGLGVQVGRAAEDDRGQEEEARDIAATAGQEPHPFPRFASAASGQECRCQAALSSHPLCE